MIKVKSAMVGVFSPGLSSTLQIQYMRRAFLEFHSYRSDFFGDLLLAHPNLPPSTRLKRWQVQSRDSSEILCYAQVNTYTTLIYYTSLTLLINFEKILRFHFHNKNVLFDLHVHQNPYTRKN